MNLVFKNFGSVLGGRKVAADLRSQIESSSEVITLDFADVRTVSHSFADELIGKLAKKYGPAQFKEKIKIINLSESNRAIFTYVISDRISSSKAA